MGKINANYKSNGLLRMFYPSTHETLAVFAPFQFYDDFKGILLNATNDWTVAGVNSGTAAVNAGAGGWMRITTGAADTDDVDVASPLIFLANKGCCCEARIAVNDIAMTAFNFGFASATGFAADVIGINFATTVLTTTAVDAMLFFADALATSNVIRAGSVKTNVDGTVFTSTVAPVNGTFHIYRIEIDDDITGRFYLDGILLGTQLLVANATTPLCLYFGFMNDGEAAANTMDVDYVRAWQKR